ncbi:MAG: 30S ribosomal protein S17, partial [Bacteroidia bacterium]|nr:30S ribosomal protein S17 [Bacteroidia bacterium]
MENPLETPLAVEAPNSAEEGVQTTENPVEERAPAAAATPAQGPTDNRQPKRKERVGVVASAAMNKTIIVVVERRTKHPIYGKFIKKSKRFAVHD